MIQLDTSKDPNLVLADCLDLLASTLAPGNHPLAQSLARDSRALARDMRMAEQFTAAADEIRQARRQEQVLLAAARAADPDMPSRVAAARAARRAERKLS
jgi:hypothetical protein